MERDTVLYGGTDPGRFNPTYMIFCESQIPASKRNSMNPSFDRRDVILITQNALADGTYLQYIRAHYNRSAQIDPPFFSELVRGPKELEAGEKTNIISRMARPLDRFFLSLGDNIEKDRRAGTSFFTQSDFTDLPGLTAKLKAADPLATYISSKLSAETKQALTANASSARKSLAKDLNTLLEAGALYEPARFVSIKLSDRTRRFIKEDPKSHTRIRLNRILLEEAYPGCFLAKVASCGNRAIVPSVFMISQMTAAGWRSAIRARSTLASVCPARRRTPPCFARSGNMWPGWTRSAGRAAGSARTRMVRARSAALMPVLMPAAASTATVKSVLCVSRFSRAMRSRPRASARSSVMGTQMRPRPWVAMKLTASGVIFSAAMTRSPSFSRSSSSVTMIMRPARSSARTSSMESNCGALGIGWS